ncbi:MAG: hypothetical protein RL030_1912 [Pseudomonadota bacterium]
MNTRTKFGVAVAAGLLSTVSALAAESAGDAGKRCAQILGERERLACFDRAFTAGPETAALAESRAAAAVAPVAVAAPVAAAAPAAAFVAAPVAAASAATIASAPSMGDEQIKKNEKQAKEASAEPKSLTARVTALKQTRQDVWRVSLDNGQVWQQMDMASTFNPGVGDTVEIQRKMMGGYSMALTAGKKSPWVRVSRSE